MFKESTILLSSVVLNVVSCFIRGFFFFLPERLKNSIAIVYGYDVQNEHIESNF